MSTGRHKYREQWHKFASVLATGYRPYQFDAAWAVVQDKISGMYESEAWALWKILSRNNIRSIVEVGRNLGGTLWLFSCACQKLETIWSIDIEKYDLTDDLFSRYFMGHDISSVLYVEDSTQFSEAWGMWDFVFIDGGHTGPTVAADIEIWKDHARLIGFHDYADRGAANKHKRVFADVVHEIHKAELQYGWHQVGARGRSEIVYRTQHY